MCSAFPKCVVVRGKITLFRFINLYDIFEYHFQDLNYNFVSHCVSIPFHFFSCQKYFFSCLVACDHHLGVSMNLL